jgi:hypothetical protein
MVHSVDFSEVPLLLEPVLAMISYKRYISLAVGVHRQNGVIPARRCSGKKLDRIA